MGSSEKKNTIEMHYEESEELSENQHRIDAAFDLLFEEVMKDFHPQQLPSKHELTTMYN